ncbi:MAG: HAD-IC family P-type ATPase [Tenericutes bacterium]|nr:HAD-IC family P-type ATPase [Mycoplasmatota bacterium]
MKNIERYTPDIKCGLTNYEVDKRIKDNLVNIYTEVGTKTVSEIVKENVLTLFNIINVVLAIAVICVGSFKNLTFIIIITINTLISIIQELRSKRTLDKLKVVAASKVHVIRNSIEKEIGINEIVLDDIIKVEIGNQIVVDSIIKDGEVEVDESFITGEADTVFKRKGDMLLSGSFIVSGKAICQVEHIGYDNYTAKISSDTKYIKAVSSEIMRSLNKIISTISFLIVPVGILLFSRQMYIEGNTVSQAVVSTVAALIGMIPEGLVLLTSTVLAVSVIRLSQRKVLVQDLYCIETLARVDTLCLDKTGTITEGKMEVMAEVFVEDINISEIIGNINYNLGDNNPTAVALLDKYGKSDTFEIVDKMPFSSAKKYSGIALKDKAYVVGAAEFILKKDDKFLKKVEEYTNEYRVILLAEALNKQLDNVRPLALLLLQDKIRSDANETLQYFREQGVTLKIISGDNPHTVYGIACRAGFKENAKIIDATTLVTDQDILDAAWEYDIFGRVTPEQKKKLVLALQHLGHTVAMTGDGVNDVLALKKADCSIAMASGSDSTKNVSQLVLLDSNFSSMPYVVAEGRRTINNIEKSSSLFLVKTIYATLLAIIFIFIDMPYPFIPIQLSLASTVTVGIPSFILALQDNYDLVQKHFLKRVLKRAVPPAFTIIINILVVFIASKLFNFTYEQTSTLSAMITGYVAFMLLFKTCLPFNKLRIALFSTMVLLYITGFFGFRSLFSFSVLNFRMIVIILLCIGFAHFMYYSFEKIINYLESKVRK